ncbi:hypothetical protein PN498_02135 [Oscillatoria sp. CS-180]|uniref:hypothetical protein n=1 Tax=Oscillatoria sp. CS-180 TaxID=3021720 RepID=UPI00232C65C1|nr:hypothetical protein [Oscillatoria sp. CS-180]MDB9524773.1 hypothetical protein [Oscillatoria sp. CS-180]
MGVGHRGDRITWLSSRTLLILDPETGQLNRITDCPDDSILPEAALTFGALLRTRSIHSRCWCKPATQCPSPVAHIRWCWCPKPPHKHGHRSEQRRWAISA